MPWHPPGDGVDRVLDVDAALLEEVRELAHVVLRLRDRHPVARDDDDLARERELHGDVVGSRRANGAAVVGSRLPDARLHLAERAEEDVGDRAVHRLRHQQREQRARGADEHPGDDEHRRVEHEAGRRRGEAGERVQERDHDRHVRAADREHEHHAEDQREKDERDDRPLRLEPRDDRDTERRGGAEDRRRSRRSGPGRRSGGR